jgi:hypothetical protein
MKNLVLGLFGALIIGFGVSGCSLAESDGIKCNNDFFNMKKFNQNTIIMHTEEVEILPEWAKKEFGKMNVSVEKEDRVKTCMFSGFTYQSGYRTPTQFYYILEKDGDIESVMFTIGGK